MMLCLRRSLFHCGINVVKGRHKVDSSLIHKIVLRRIQNSSSSDVKLETSAPSVDILLENLKIPYVKGFTCFKINKCLVCSEKKGDSNSSNDTEIYVNKHTGHFFCKKCKVSGNLPVLCEAYDSLNKETTSVNYEILFDSCSKHDLSSEWNEVKNCCFPLHSLNDERFNNILQSFKIKSFNKKLSSALDIHIHRDMNFMYFPIYHLTSVVGYKVLDLNGNSSTIPQKDCPGSIIHPTNSKSLQAIVVANLKDFISLVSLNLALDVICLPYGISTLPQTLLPSFEHYNKIILWFGEEYDAWHSSIQFAKKLNDKRCYLIRPIEGQTSAQEAVSNGRNIKQIISNAKPVWHQFVTTFSSLRQEVLAQLHNINVMKGVAWKRFPMLNQILKGHRRGELTILTGPTGAGKTTFLSEYSLDLAMQGVNTLWGSFEIKNTRLALTMLQQYSGVPFLKDYSPFNKWADKFEKLPIYFMTFHGQNSLPIVTETVNHCFYTYDIAHVIIDNVQFMIDVRTDNKGLERFWIQDCIIQTFRRFATLNNCHVTLVMHPRKEADGTNLNMSSIFGSAKAIQEADNIMILQHSIDGKIWIQICKNRFSGDLGNMYLSFNKTNQRFIQSQNTINTDTSKDKNEVNAENEKYKRNQITSRISF